MFRVIVESASGVALGAGPLQSVSNVKITIRIDRAGSISFEMAATDADAALFPDNASTYVRVRDFRDGTWITVGRGVIKHKSLSSDKRTLTLSGPCLSDELLRTHVGTLALTDDLTVTGDPMAAADVLPAILDYALTGWSTSGTPSSDVYYQFGDETVLAALIKVADITGDHFRFEDRTIVWLPTTSAGFVAADSGIRAIDVGDPDSLMDNDDVCLIDGGLEVATDDTQRITRIYPRGGGNADARLYLNDATYSTTRFSAAGVGDYTSGDFTLHLDADPAQSYIKHDESEEDGIGLFDATLIISAVESFRDIAPLDGSTDAAISASNQLFDAALVTLMRRIVAQKAYRLRVRKVVGDLVVGESLLIKVKHITDDYKWIDERVDVMMLEITESHDAESGEPLVDLQVTV